MSGTPHATHANTSPGEGATSTRQPTQLAVLLAGMGAPPLEAGALSYALTRIYDAFVLAPERLRLFVGEARALFRAPAESVDPRHDPLARALRAVTVAARQRIENYEAAHPDKTLLRGLAPLAPWRVEGQLGSFDLRTTVAGVRRTHPILGSLTPEVDPIDSPESGLLRRVLALAARGLLVEKPGRGRGGIVADLGALTLVLALLDLAANPRSALRALRVRLSKHGKLAEDQSARVRDVAAALREILSFAVFSATASGNAGRDLVKDTTLTHEVLEHFAVGLARAVYDGLAPDDEHPVVVPGVEASDAFTVAPLLVPSPVGEVPDEPTLGLYNRIAFVPLPYARMLGQGPSGVGTASEPPRPARTSVLDERAFERAREALQRPMQPATAPVTALGAQVDPLDPRHAWSPCSLDAVPRMVAQTAEQGPPATHIVVLLGPRGAGTRAALDAIASTLACGARFHQLVPRVSDGALVFVPLPQDTSSAAAALRRGDVSRWLDEDAPRAVQWDLEPGARVVVNAASLEAAGSGSHDALLALARDLGDRVAPRAVLFIVGAPTYAAAADLLAALARRPDLESGDAPLRGQNVWMLRTDAPVQIRAELARGPDESALAALADAFTSALSPLSDFAARAALTPAEAKYRGRLVRLAALGTAAHPMLVHARRALERACADPSSGAAARRAFQAGIGSLGTTRAALSAGMYPELSACMHHEVALLVSEWERGQGRSHAQRLADVARGQLVELVLAAHPRAAVVIDDALLGALSPWLGDSLERASALESLHGAALGARIGGTVYATDDARDTPPLAFVLRAGGTEVLTLADASVDSNAPRARPVRAPHLELTWRPQQGHEVSMSMAAALLSALCEQLRRAGTDLPLRAAQRDARVSYAALLDVGLDNRLALEFARFLLPLRSGVNAADVQRFGIELTMRLSEATSSDAASEWSLTVVQEGKGSVVVPLGGPALLREFVARWTRALRMLPRHFPTATAVNARYASSLVVESAADLGLVSALMRERGIPEKEANARALRPRLNAAAAEVLPSAREVAARMPLRERAHEGDDWDVLERYLLLAWFLSVNFCTAAKGPLRWAPEGGASVKPILDEHVDRSALKLWLQRKTSQPDAVEARVRALLDALEPNVLVEEA